MGSGRPSWVVQVVQVRIFGSGWVGAESLGGTYEEGISLWKM